MNFARMAVLGVAVGAGVLAAVLALNFTRQPAPAAGAVSVATAVETVDVLVAAKDVATGATLKPESLRWEKWPRAGVSDKFITRQATPEAITDAVGSFVRSTIHVGEPIVETKLIRGDAGFMSAILPAGKRAVATRIAADTSAGGFILPNDHVDVIMTRRVEGAPSGYVTETILNNVRVLAIDQTIEEKDGQKVVVGQTATLELSPQQAEILTVAQQMGERLTLALRSLADAQRRPGEERLDAKHLVGGAKREGWITVYRAGNARQISRGE